MEISIMLPDTTMTISTPSLYADIPVVDISMWEFVAGIGGLPLIALGLALLEKHTDLDMTRVNEIFGSSLPFVALIFVGWFFLKIGAMFL